MLSACRVHLEICTPITLLVRSTASDCRAVCLALRTRGHANPSWRMSIGGMKAPWPCCPPTSERRFSVTTFGGSAWTAPRNSSELRTPPRLAPVLVLDVRDTTPHQPRGWCGYGNMGPWQADLHRSYMPRVAPSQCAQHQRVLCGGRAPCEHVRFGVLAWWAAPAPLRSFCRAHPRRMAALQVR